MSAETQELVDPNLPTNKPETTASEKQTIDDEKNQNTINAPDSEASDSEEDESYQPDDELNNSSELVKTRDSDYKSEEGEEVTSKPKSDSLKNLFEGVKVSLLGTFHNTQQGLVKSIRNNGGIARQGLTTLFQTKKEPTTHVCTNEDALKGLGEEFIKRISRHKMKIVTENWITDCIAHERLVDETPYFIPSVEEIKKKFKNDESDNDKSDPDYIEIHVKKRKKTAHTNGNDKRARKKRNIRGSPLDVKLEEEVSLEGMNLLSTFAIKTEEKYQNEKIMKWSPDEVTSWVSDCVNIEKEELQKLLNWVLQESIDGEALLEVDYVSDLGGQGLKVGTCLKFRKAIRQLKQTDEQ
ncbi:hypothetical protein AKO1_014938 [Acrasis kona]|uniref:BRCT domain-containing protein n=1 Tax=Acrasis kona TaxID=1008807 RepID=A0AAW2YZV2_9EUKA